jgi:hypothetical protein
MCCFASFWDPKTEDCPIFSFPPFQNTLCPPIGSRRLASYNAKLVWGSLGYLLNNFNSQGEGYTWAQTKREVLITVPLPAGTRARGFDFSAS